MNDAKTETRPTVLVVGDPIQGLEFFGPFASEAAAYAYQETGLQDCRPSWAAPLIPDPLHADDADEEDDTARTWLACPECGCTDLGCDAVADPNRPELLAVVTEGDLWCRHCHEEFPEAETVDAEKPCDVCEREDAAMEGVGS